MRLRLVALAAVAALAACRTTAAPGPGAPAGAKSQPRPQPPGPRAHAPVDPAVDAAIAAAVRAHEVLVSDSVVPADSARISTAALAALAASIGGVPPTPAWSDDPERDRALLAERAGALAAAATVHPAPADLPLRVVRAMALAAADPHVLALDGETMAGLLAATSGLPFAGPGFVPHRAGPDWVVADVYPGGPAERAGLARGALVRSVDGRPVDMNDYINHFSMREGRTMTLEILAPGAASTVQLAFALRLSRPPILERKVLPHGVGYLRIHIMTASQDPSADAGALLETALAELDRRKVKQLVLDLRENLGGNPVAVASVLAAGDPLLMASRPGEPSEPIARDRTPWKKRRPIAVLVNDQTYSAAEMVALVLREREGAPIIGQPTGGALTFPHQAELPSGVLLFYPESVALGPRTLTAPEGRRLTPDVLVPNLTAADYAAGRDPQLDAALALLRKQK